MAQLIQLSDFIPLIRPQVRGCEEPMILAALRRAAKQFCEDTEVWREDVTAAVVVDQRQYDISYTDSRVLRIVDVRLVDESQEDVRDPDSGVLFDSTRYQLVHVAGVETLDFLKAWIPSDDYEDYTVVVKRSLAPHELTDPLPDEFLTDWGTGIRAGALQELFSEAEKPWSNVDQAARYLASYTEQTSRAKFDILHERKRASNKAGYPRVIL